MMPELIDKIEVYLDKNGDPVDDPKDAVTKYVTIFNDNDEIEDQYETEVDVNEAVTLVGPHPVAQIKKKKRHFEFKENLDEHWESLLNEVRFRAFTHSSSFVGNVKYDQDNQTMEIILNGKKYDFCNVSERLFDAFEGADSKGAFFNREIKSLHDC